MSFVWPPPPEADDLAVGDAYLGITLSVYLAVRVFRREGILGVDWLEVDRSGGIRHTHSLFPSPSPLLGFTLLQRAG